VVLFRFVPRPKSEKVGLKGPSGYSFPLLIVYSILIVSLKDCPPFVQDLYIGRSHDTIEINT